MFTLFNLQGALGVFHRIFRRFIGFSVSARNSFILAHLKPFVKNFFQILFVRFSVLVLLSKQLAHNTT